MAIFTDVKRIKNSTNGNGPGKNSGNGGGRVGTGRDEPPAP